MSNDVTARFFHWMNAHNITRSQAAELLGVDERSLSTYKGRGLPRKQTARAEQVMREHAATKEPAASAADENRISISFTDEQYKLVDDASRIAGCEFKEFVQKSACSEARKKIAKHEAERLENFPPLDKVADDGHQSAPMPPQNPNTTYPRKGNGTSGKA